MQGRDLVKYDDPEKNEGKENHENIMFGRKNEKNDEDRSRKESRQERM